MAQIGGATPAQDRATLLREHAKTIVRAPDARAPAVDPAVVVAVPRGYYTALATGELVCSADGQPLLRATVLHACTSCGAAETAAARFGHCPRCFTVYCSKACFARDEKEGEHRKHCKPFGQKVARTIAYYKCITACEPCARDCRKAGFAACDACRAKVAEDDRADVIV